MKALKIGELTARIPVIQGGMGVGISLSGLAGSVAACGGVGVISTAQIGYRDPEFEKDPIKTNLRVIGEEIQKAREIAKGGILGVNIMVALKHYRQHIETAVEAGADVIICGAGLPADLPGPEGAPAPVPTVRTGPGRGWPCGMPDAGSATARRHGRCPRRACGRRC